MCSTLAGVSTWGSGGVDGDHGEVSSPPAAIVQTFISGVAGSQRIGSWSRAFWCQTSTYYFLLGRRGVLGFGGSWRSGSIGNGRLLTSSEMFLYFKQLVYSYTGVHTWRPALTPEPPPWGFCWGRGPSWQSRRGMGRLKEGRQWEWRDGFWWESALGS